VASAKVDKPVAKGAVVHQAKVNKPTAKATAANDHSGKLRRGRPSWTNPWPRLLLLTIIVRKLRRNIPWSNIVKRSR
jgi:hypothetical protein